MYLDYVQTALKSLEDGRIALRGMQRGEEPADQHRLCVVAAGPDDAAVVSGLPSGNRRFDAVCLL